MMRRSPMSRVFSMEPEGMTRAWPRVPLMSMKARMTQNQAMISLLTLALMEASDSFAGAPLLVCTLIASAFTNHLHLSDRPCCYFRTNLWLVLFFWILWCRRAGRAEARRLHWLGHPFLRQGKAEDGRYKYQVSYSTVTGSVVLMFEEDSRTSSCTRSVG